MKNVVSFFAMFLFLSQGVFARQNASLQVQDLKNFALEVGEFVKNDWCHVDEQVARSRWADFFNRLAPLSRVPYPEKTYDEFYRQTLFEVNANNYPYFYRYFSEFIGLINSVKQSEIELTEADHWGPNQMTLEYKRWVILLWAMAPSGASVMATVKPFYSQFVADFPKPPAYYDDRDYACLDYVTKGINNVPVLKLGSSAIFAMWNTILSP